MLPLGTLEIVLFDDGAIGHRQCPLPNPRKGQSVGSVIHAAARFQGDPHPRPPSRPGVGRVSEGAVEAQAHAPERVDELGESPKVHGGVVVDLDAQIQPDGALQGADSTGSAGGKVRTPDLGVLARHRGKGVDLIRVQACSEDAAVWEWHEPRVARDRDHHRRMTYRVDADNQDGVGERLRSARVRIDAQQQEVDARLAVPVVVRLVEGLVRAARGDRSAAGEDVMQGPIEAAEHDTRPGMHDHRQNDEQHHGGDLPGAPTEVRRSCRQSSDRCQSGCARAGRGAEGAGPQRGCTGARGHGADRSSQAHVRDREEAPHQERKIQRQ